MQTNVSNDEAVNNLIERTVSEFGTLDILINNAGITIPGGIEETTIADYDTVMGVNLRALYVASKLAIPHLKKPSGRIIHIASVQAFGGGGGPAYAASKAGVVNLTRDTALELAPFGATVNAICPGYIETPIQDYLTPQDIEDSRAKTPLPPPGLAIRHRQRRGILRIGRRRLDHRHSPARGRRMDGVYFLIRINAVSPTDASFGESLRGPR